MNFHEQFATDKKAEQDGRWFDMGPDSRIKLRSFTSQKSKEVRRDLETPYAAILRNGSLSDEINEDIATKQMAQAIIVDWENFQDVVVDDNGNIVLDENGDPKTEVVQHSEANALRMLKKYHKFREFVAATVINDDSFKAKLRGDAEGN